MATPDIELGMPMDEVIALAMGGVVILLGLFALLAWVRSWGIRMKKEGGACGGLDLEHLRRQRDAGDIRSEEYEAIRAHLAGAPSGPPSSAQADASDAPSERSINDIGGEPERNSADG